jgi:hypothetical protein
MSAFIRFSEAAPSALELLLVAGGAVAVWMGIRQALRMMKKG